MDNTYKTFWRRFFAGCIDGIVFMIIGFATSMFTTPDGEVFTPLQTIADNGVWLVYTIYLHGRYGQTLGKMVFKVKVVTPTGDKITFLHAFKRDIVYLILAVVALATFFTHKEEYDSYNESMAFIESYKVTSGNHDDEEFNKHLGVVRNVWGSPVMWIGSVTMIYFLLEVITMLTNRKRRTIHDFIAGTEVRRLE